MSAALTNIKEVIQPEGIGLFRDSGLYDHSMVRFAPRAKLGDRFYYQQDSTSTNTCYFGTGSPQNLLVRVHNCTITYNTHTLYSILRNGRIRLNWS